MVGPAGMAEMGLDHLREGRAADIVLLCLQLSRWDLEVGLSPK